jgi:hypothetical protein
LPPGWTTIIRLRRIEAPPPADLTLYQTLAKPAQTIDAPVKSVREMTDAELMAIAAGLDDDNPSQTH